MKARIVVTAEDSDNETAIDDLTTRLAGSPIAYTLEAETGPLGLTMRMDLYNALCTKLGPDNENAAILEAARLRYAGKSFRFVYTFKDGHVVDVRAVEVP